MRAIPAIALVMASMALASTADAQTRRPSIDRPDAGRGATTGAAPALPRPGEAPVGHRQPNSADTPNETQGVTPYDRQIDRNLQICRDC